MLYNNAFARFLVKRICAHSIGFGYSIIKQTALYMLALRNLTARIRRIYYINMVFSFQGLIK